MAVSAVHAAFEMNIVEVHGFAELCRIVGRDNVPLRIEEIAFAIAFEDFAKQPAVAVRISELSVAQKRVELRRARVFEKFKVSVLETQTHLKVENISVTARRKRSLLFLNFFCIPASTLPYGSTLYRPNMDAD